MRGAQFYEVKGLRGLERDISPLPGLPSPDAAYLAQDVRIGDTVGAIEKFGGRKRINMTAFPAGAKLPGHVLGFMQARLSGGDFQVAVTSGNDLTSQIVQNVEYAEPNWSMSDITRAAYVPQCPVNRRFSFAILNDRLVMSDFAVTALEQWVGGAGGATKTTALTTTNGPTKARYLHTARDFMFAAHTIEGGTSYNNRLRWCDAGNPNAWTSTNYFDLGPYESDERLFIAQLIHHIEALSHATCRSIQSSKNVRYPRH